MAADSTLDQSPVQTATPVATMGFGAREDADTTRQSQHMEANDAPVDVNMNAVTARVQAGTFAIMGGNFEAHANILNKLQERFLAKVS